MTIENWPIYSKIRNQTRGFIHVKDIAQANLNALEHENANYKAMSMEHVVICNGAGMYVRTAMFIKLCYKMYTE